MIMVKQFIRKTLFSIFFSRSMKKQLMNQNIAIYMLDFVHDCITMYQILMNQPKKLM